MGGVTLALGFGAARSVVPRSAKQAWAKASEFAHSRLALGVLTSAGVGFLGDQSAQTLTGDQDVRRTVAMTSFSAIYMGLVYPLLVFPWMDRVITQKRMRMGAAGVLTAKVLFENLVQTPLVYFPAFYLFTGAVRGNSMEEISDRARASFIPNNVVNCAMWIPASAVVFAFVPIPMRVYAFNAVSFLWNNTLALVTERSRPAALVIEDHGERRLAVDQERTHASREETSGQREPLCEDRTGAAEIHAKGAGGMFLLRKELELGGRQLDEAMRARLGGDELREIDAYRYKYAAFRNGSAHGSSDFVNATCASSYRQEYTSFRKGAAKGCKTSSSMMAVAA